MSKRVAAIDCGTNSIRLLICDIDDGKKTDVLRLQRIVRLGQDVDRTGRLAPEALERTFAATREYADIISKQDVEVVRFCATSAARDADNSDEFVDGIVSILGTKPEVLTGADEAYATYTGAARDLENPQEPVLVVDLGGGSTELVLGQGSDVLVAQSLDIGCVRMSERHLFSDPPTDTEIANARKDISAALDSTFVDVKQAKSVVGVAGSMTTIAAHVLGLSSYDPERIHHSRLPKLAVLDTCNLFAHSSQADLRSFGFMHPQRVDVIGAGALVVLEIMDRVKVDTLTVSEKDILDGIAWGAIAN